MTKIILTALATGALAIGAHYASKNKDCCGCSTNCCEKGSCCCCTTSEKDNCC